MFKHIKCIANNVVQAALRRVEDNLRSDMIEPNPEPNPEPYPKPKPTEPEPKPKESKEPEPNPKESKEPEPNPKESKEPEPNPYETSETAVIDQWRATLHSTDVQITLRALIGMIQRLCFFSEPDKRCLRTYGFDRDDMTKMIEKIRRRPRLMIDTSDIDTHDRVAMGAMFNNMRKIIGMFYVRNFVVRVETTFDNTQIRSEHHVMSRLGLEHIGVDHANHVVVPMHVQLSSIENVPPSVRTPFHHISYSIQPMVQHSRTLDSWHRHARPTRTAIMALCKQMAEALVHLHAHNVVHGDIKPGNTLVKGAELYVIDFGMSGAHDDSEGTGGTKPYCAPETGNGNGSSSSSSSSSGSNNNDADSYNWTQNRMENDVWSFGLMFFTMLALRRCIYHPNEYPAGFFNCDGFVNASHFDNIRERALFQRILCPRETRCTAAECLHAINQLELELEQQQLDELDEQQHQQLD
jgi:hypothetical protein